MAIGDVLLGMILEDCVDAGPVRKMWCIRTALWVFYHTAVLL